jgi:MFS family permease
VAACALLLLLHATSPIWLLLVIAVAMGVPQGLNSLALQNSLYHQADPDRMGSSAGLLRTFGYLGAIAASAASGTFLSRHADTPGLHHLAWFMLATAGLFLALTVADRGLARIGVASRKGDMEVPNTGIATGGVVLCTLRQAADLDYRLTVCRTAATTPTRRCTRC